MKEERAPVPPKHMERASAGSILALLQERKKLYNDAIFAAKELNDVSKVRRYTRAAKVSISNRFVNFYIFIFFSFFFKLVPHLVVNSLWDEILQHFIFLVHHMLSCKELCKYFVLL